MSGAAGLFISRNFRLLLRFQKYPVHVAALPRFVTAGGFLSMSFKDEELKKRLTPLQYQVTQKKGTEMAFTGEYEKNKEPGMYNCVVCGEPLFKSDHKYDSGSGWPSFDRPVDDKNIQRNSDKSLGRERTEVVCKKCQAHLGHVFTDGPASTGERYCINSASLAFDKKNKDEL